MNYTKYLFKITKIDIDIILCYNANVYIVYHSYTFRLLNTKFSESYYETFRAN